MRTTLFTGAGASRAIGYPLTSDLLPRVRDGIRAEKLFANTNTRERDKAECRELSSYLSGLLPGFERATDESLPLITDVFSLVEYAIASGEALPVGGDINLRRFRDLLKHAIADILLSDFLADWDEDRPEDVCQKKLLKQLAGWIVGQRETIGLVTTNYDIGLEYEIYESMGHSNVRKTVDLGFDWRDAASNKERTRPDSPALRVYKLHGSLDTLRCPLCGYVYFNPWGAIAQEAFREPLDDDNSCECHEKSRLELHIVAPSLVRDVRDANLLSVWRSALEWMRRSEHWVLVGYSLPSEDLAVRSLLLRAYAGASKPPKVTVVQYGDHVRARYEMLFPNCHYYSDGLESYMRTVG